MPKQSTVAVAAGASFTSIRASIALHSLKVYEDGERTHLIEYQRKDDSFATTYTAAAGDIIQIIGHGKSGLLGRPPGYNASGIPAQGDIVLKVRDQSGSAINVIVEESENQL